MTDVGEVGERDEKPVAFDARTFGRGEALPDDHGAVHELVARFASAEPERVAVVSGGESCSYERLCSWSDAISERLQAMGVGPGCTVGVLVSPSTAMVASVLGVLGSGAAYVPIDPAQPDKLISRRTEDAGAAAILVTSDTAARVGASAKPLIDVHAVECRPPSHPFTQSAVTGADAAYVIFTSGSTGEPKGVVVEHAQLAASTLARRMVYPGPSVFLLVSPLAFDSSTAGIWGTLTTGGTLVVATADEQRDPSRLVELVASHGVTRLLCVPTLYAVVLDAAEREGLDKLRSLEQVVVAGEPLSAQLLARHFLLHQPGAALVNEYGPTEATVWATCRWFDEPGPVSIGTAIPGARLYVLDDDGRAVPLGVAGELFIGGAGVARGYLGRPDATTAAFVLDPFVDAVGARMYRTGDLVRWNDDGTLHFIGRRDHQVKIRGHRVELGVVEQAMRSLPGVREAVATVDSTGSRLMAFVVGSPDLSGESIRTALADKLPHVMVPSTVTVLDQLPLTVTGKVDRTRLALSEPSSSSPVRSGDDVISQVITAWAEVLKCGDVPLDVNFFDAGGHSLVMFDLQNALERQTGSRPSVTSLFRHTTVTAQAVLIAGGAAATYDARETRHAAARRARELRARRAGAHGRET